MADSGDAQQPWVPYSQRPKWADVTPAEVADADGGIVAIQYSTQHRELLGFWRAVMAKVRAAAARTGCGVLWSLAAAPCGCVSPPAVVAVCLRTAAHPRASAARACWA